MKKSTYLLIATIISAGGLSLSATANAQDRTQNVKERLQARQLQPTRRVVERRLSFAQQQHAKNSCKAGETKHFVIAGVEDGFSQSGSEPAVKSSRVATQTFEPAWNTGIGGSFDGRSVNRKIFSHLNLPNNVRSGKFMIGLDPIGELLGTDGMSIGNLGSVPVSGGPVSPNRTGFRYTGTNWVPSVGGGNLTTSGKNHVIDFSSMALVGGGNLQSYYQSSGDTILDVYVQDDHSVDYVAASVCAGSDKKGMTWGVRDPQPESVNGVAHVGCHDSAGGKCEPYKGDTACSTALPILCLNPMKLQKPANLTESKWDKWSGGVIGTTNPMSAPSTLAAANAECVKEFGPGWRVAEHHDAHTGSSGWAFSAYGNVGTKGKRFWADIRNQPNGICWTR